LGLRPEATLKSHGIECRRRLRARGVRDQSYVRKTARKSLAFVPARAIGIGDCDVNFVHHRLGPATCIAVQVLDARL
jgi:hypothetical protein